MQSIHSATRMRAIERYMKKYRFRMLWVDQLRKSKFSLYYENSDDFVYCQWFDWLLPFCFYRSVVACYALGIGTYAALQFNQPSKTMIYPTYWIHLALTIGLIVAAVNDWIAYVHSTHISTDDQVEIKLDLEISWNIKLQWILTNIYATGSFVVFIMVWGYTFPEDVPDITATLTAINIAVVTIDLLGSRTPIHIFHVYIPGIIFLLYDFWVIAFWWADMTNDNGEPYIYRLLDLQGSQLTAVGVILTNVLVTVPICQLWVYVLYTVREWVYLIHVSKEPIDPGSESNVQRRVSSPSDSQIPRTSACVSNCSENDWDKSDKWTKINTTYG